MNLELAQTNGGAMGNFCFDQSTPLYPVGPPVSWWRFAQSPRQGTTKNFGSPLVGRAQVKVFVVFLNMLAFTIVLFFHRKVDGFDFLFLF